jgi:hypothetical protein
VKILPPPFTKAQMSDKIIYSNALKCKTTLESLISDLQHNYTPNQYFQTNSTISQFHSFIQDLQQFIKRQVNQEKKLLMQERVTSLLKDYSTFQNQITIIKQQQDTIIAQQKQQEREQLGLHQRREPTFLDIDIKEQRVLDYTSTSVDQYISIGTTALQELYDQRSILKVRYINKVDTKTVTGRGDEIGVIDDGDAVY